MVSKSSSRTTEGGAEHAPHGGKAAILKRFQDRAGGAAEVAQTLADEAFRTG